MFSTLPPEIIEKIIFTLPPQERGKFRVSKEFDSMVNNNRKWGDDILALLDAPSHPRLRPSICSREIYFMLHKLFYMPRYFSSDYYVGVHDHAKQLLNVAGSFFSQEKFKNTILGDIASAYVNLQLFLMKDTKNITPLLQHQDFDIDRLAQYPSYFAKILAATIRYSDSRVDNQEEKLAELVSIWRRMGIKIDRPDIRIAPSMRYVKALSSKPGSDFLKCIASEYRVAATNGTIIPDNILFSFMQQLKAQISTSHGFIGASKVMKLVGGSRISQIIRPSDRLFYCIMENIDNEALRGYLSDENTKEIDEQYLLSLLTPNAQTAIPEDNFSDSASDDGSSAGDEDDDLLSSSSESSSGSGLSSSGEDSVEQAPYGDWDAPPIDGTSRFAGSGLFTRPLQEAEDREEEPPTKRFRSGGQ